MELTPPHWFGWWTVCLIVLLGGGVWLLWYSKNTEHTPSEFQPVSPPKNRQVLFESSNTLRKLAVLLLQRYGEYDASVPLGVTLLGLQKTPQRKQHNEFLANMERSLYDPLYDTQVSLEQMKQYMIDHEFFD
jgi:hypothetical protein